MTIKSRDELVNAMANGADRLIFDKASISNAAAGQWHSLWRATGQPGQGAIPAGAAACDHTTVGGHGFAQQTSPATSYIALIDALCVNASTTLEFHDRLAHMGGLSGTVTTAQTVGLDLDSLKSGNNLAARIGSADYSDVQWWLEWFADTGSTAVTVTVNVTYDDTSTGNLTGQSLSATRRASFMQSLNGLIPSAKAGQYIRGVNSVTLSATTGTAGNFGVTATKYRAGCFRPLANARMSDDWAALGCPEVPNSSCLFIVEIAGTTSTGIVRASGKLIHG